MSAAYPVRVYWEDTDGSGVVYHANYLRWLERARTEWLRQLGFSQQEMMISAGIGFTVASIEIRYLKPARLDDELLVRTRVCDIGKASIVFKQEIHYAHSDKEILAMASVRAGCVGLTNFRPQRMPAAIEKAFLKEKLHVG